MENCREPWKTPFANSIAVAAVDWDPLGHTECDALSAGGEVGLRIALPEVLREGLGSLGCGVGAFAVFLNVVHSDQDSLTVDRVVECFGRLGAVGILLRVLLIEAGLHL